MFNTVKPQIRIGDEQSKVLAFIVQSYPKCQIKNDVLRVNAAGVILTFSELTLEKIERM